MIENIINNWDWASKEKLDDPNHLTSLNYAILDQVIPEMVKFYVLDTCIKAVPVSKIFNNYGIQSIQDEIFSTVILQVVLKELSSISKFLPQAILYWDRRFKKGEQPDFLIEQPLTGTEAVKALIQQSMMSSDEVLDSNQQVIEPKITGAIEKSLEVMNIRHLNSSDEEVQVAFDALFVKGFDAKFNIFPVPNFTGVSDDGLLVSDNTYYSSYEKLDKGGFVFEGYIKFFLHQKTIDFLNTYVPNGEIIVDQLHGVPLSTHGLDEIFNRVLVNFTNENDSIDILNNDTIYDQHPLETLLSYIIVNIKDNIDYTIDDAGLNLENSNYMSIVGAPDQSLFSDIQYGIRLAYVTTASNTIEDTIKDFYSDGLNQESLNEIRKKKTFIYREAAPFDTGSGKILSFPIVEKDFGASERFTLNFNPDGKGAFFNKYKDDSSQIKENIDNVLDGFYMNQEDAVNKRKNLLYSIVLFTRLGLHSFNTTNKNMYLNLQVKLDAKKDAQVKLAEDLSTAQNKNEAEKAFTTYQQNLVDIDNGNSYLLSNNFKTVGLAWYFSGEKFRQSKLISEFSKTKEWQAMINYALPQNLAAGLVALYSYLNILSGLSEKGESFIGTKNLFKSLFIFSMSRSGLDGKPTNKDDIGAIDYEAYMPPDQDPPPETEDSDYEEPNEC